MKSLFIFRRDFRIKDNIAFNEMLKNSTHIYPIFIFTPEQITHNIYKSDNSVQFMIESLLDLYKDIKITFCYGSIIDVIEDIVLKNNIEAIYCNTDYTPYAIKRDEMINSLAKKLNILFNYYHDITLFEPNTVLNKSGTIYMKYTPFYKHLLTLGVKKPHTTILDSSKIKQPRTKYSIDQSKLKSFYHENPSINIHGGRVIALKILTNIKKFSKYTFCKIIMDFFNCQFILF